MASKRYDVAAPRPKKDGGTFWQRVGTAWENDKGIQVVFDAYPLPDAEGRCVVNLFEPRDDRSGARDRNDANGRAGSQPAYDDAGDAPF